MNILSAILSFKSILIFKVKNVIEVRKTYSGKLNRKIYIKITETSDKPPKTKLRDIKGVIE